jgi:hypothetical protein
MRASIRVSRNYGFAPDVMWSLMYLVGPSSGFDKGSRATLLHSAHLSPIPCWVCIALNQPPSNFDRYVELRHVFDTGRDRNQSAQQLPLLFVGQCLVPKKIIRRPHALGAGPA